MKYILVKNLPICLLIISAKGFKNVLRLASSL
jgi:hypothetical protein